MAHRSRRITRSDVKKPWKLKQFRNPAVKAFWSKCNICVWQSQRHPKGKRRPMP